VAVAPVTGERSTVHMSVARRMSSWAAPPASLRPCTLVLCCRWLHQPAGAAAAQPHRTSPTERAPCRGTAARTARRGGSRTAVCWQPRWAPARAACAATLPQAPAAGAGTGAPRCQTRWRAAPRCWLPSRLQPAARLHALWSTSAVKLLRSWKLGTGARGVRFLQRRACLETGASRV